MSIFRVASSLTKAIHYSTNLLFSRNIHISRRLAIAFTDGSCKGQGVENARAGYGVHWPSGQICDCCGRVRGVQDCQVAELCAACVAVKMALENGYSDIRIYADSFFVGFAVRNSTDFQKKSFKNCQDLVQELNEMKKRINVIVKHVKGHSGVAGNEKADKIAKAGTKLDVEKSSE